MLLHTTAWPSGKSLGMFKVSHRPLLQLPVNGSLNQHMAKQVSLFLTPVKSQLHILSNQGQPHKDMAVEGTACGPECHSTPAGQLCSYMSGRYIE